MIPRLSRKSALRLMMVGGGLVAAAPAALPQGAIGPGDMDRAKLPCWCFSRSRSKGAKIPCDTMRAPTKQGGFIGPCDYKRKGTQVEVPDAPCQSKNKAGIAPVDLQNRGQIANTPCGVKAMTPGGVKK